MDISVIVPVYNVEDYLAECLESILSQGFDSMEIICIEDGSSDDSFKILETFAQKYSQIRIIKHDTNKGPSAARNAGLKIATGKYILFVDSDDILAENALNVLYKEAEQKNVDVVYFDIEKFCDSVPDHEERCKTIWKGFDEIYTGREFFCKAMENNEYRCDTCRQLIKRDLLLNRGIYFLEGILHEDILFSFYVVMEARRISALGEKLYFYRKGHTSITKTKNNIRAQSMFVILGEIFSYWKTQDFTDEESFYIGKRWEFLYETYKLYQTYGYNSLELECGDAVDKAIYKILNRKQRKWINTAELSLDKIKTFKNIIVYGAGNAAKQIVEYLRESDIEIKCIMVKSKKDNPDIFCGIEVYEVKECLNLREKSVVIIGVTSKNSVGIEDILKDEGFKNIIRLKDE